MSTHRLSAPAERPAPVRHPLIPPLPGTVPPPAPSAPDRLTDGLGALATLVATPAEDDGDLATDLLRTVVRMVPGALWATLGERTRRIRPQTVAATADAARLADRVQFTVGEGPTLRALERGAVVTVADLGTDPRWPRLAAVARDLDVRSVLALPLRGGQGRDAGLTLYAVTADAFPEAVVRSMPAVTAAVDLARAGLRQRQRAQNLNRALLSNRRIGVGVGILMTRHHWTEEQAFQALGELSQSLNRKVADLAEEVCLTGALPAAPAASALIPEPRPEADPWPAHRRPRPATTGIPAHPGP